MTDTVVLRIRNLSVDLDLRGGTVRAIDDVSFDLHEAETVVVLGESGSGKSMTAMAIMGLLPSPPARISVGSVLLGGTELVGMPTKALREHRGSRIAMVFQDALSALNPVATVGAQVSEAVRVHSRGPKSAARVRAIELMTHVGIPNASGRFHDYPHQFSGGMRQRIMIAMAIAMSPSVLIADEPTTALDVTIQAQILDLIQRLKDEHRIGVILITHDLSVTAEIADRVVVMYAGKIVEVGDAKELLAHPAHPYTVGLLNSMPASQSKGSELAVIGGTPPSLATRPVGCNFAPRCPRARQICREVEPPLEPIAAGRASACHFWEEVLNDQAR